MFKKRFYVLLLIVVLTSFCSTGFSQNWKSMDDSAYQKIVSNRFNKGNFLLGIRVSLPDFSNNYEDLYWTFQPEVGYFIANKWMLGFDYKYGFSSNEIEHTNQKEYFQQNVFDLSLRYYLKPKHRTVFAKLGFVGGVASNINVNDAEIPSFYYLYGSEGALGFTAFFRHFELELMVGADLYLTDFDNSNIAINSFFQINISYIFSSFKNR